MSPIPNADTPAYGPLRERVEAALDRLQEAPAIDFKATSTWSDLRWPVTRAVLGMGNLRDGGIVIVGVTEQGTAWTRTGIAAGDLSTYEPDVIRDQLDEYVSPFANVEVVQCDYRDTLSCLVFQISEFEETPLVCKKNGPSGSKLVEGAIYHRPFAGRPRTSRIVRAEDMNDLLELAAEKRARRIIGVSSRLGVSVSGPNDSERFETELGGL